MSPPDDLLASGILLGGSSVALALTALAARRATRCARRSAFASASTIADRKAAHADALAAKTHAEHAMRAANAASLDRLFTPPHGITVTQPETVDVIPIPVPKPKLYEVEDTPGAVVYGADAGDANVIEFGHYWQDHGDAGA
jgi:Flp pilus assembly secretin CpaC